MGLRRTPRDPLPRRCYRRTWGRYPLPAALALRRPGQGRMTQEASCGGAGGRESCGQGCSSAAQLVVGAACMLAAHSQTHPWVDCACLGPSAAASSDSSSWLRSASASHRALSSATLCESSVTEAPWPGCPWSADSVGLVGPDRVAVQSFLTISYASSTFFLRACKAGSLRVRRGPSTKYLETKTATSQPGLAPVLGAQLLQLLVALAAKCDVVLRGV